MELKEPLEEISSPEPTAIAQDKVILTPTQSQPKVAIPIPLPILTQDSMASQEDSNEEEPPLEFKDIEGEAGKRESKNAHPMGYSFSSAGDEYNDTRKTKKGLTVRSSIKSKKKE